MMVDPKTQQSMKLQGLNTLFGYNSKNSKNSGEQQSNLSKTQFDAIKQFHLQKP